MPVKKTCRKNPKFLFLVSLGETVFHLCNVLIKFIKCIVCTELMVQHHSVIFQTSRSRSCKEMNLLHLFLNETPSGLLHSTEMFVCLPPLDYFFTEISDSIL